MVKRWPRRRGFPPPFFGADAEPTMAWGRKRPYSRPKCDLPLILEKQRRNQRGNITNRANRRGSVVTGLTPPHMADCRKNVDEARPPPVSGLPITLICSAVSPLPERSTSDTRMVSSFVARNGPRGRARIRYAMSLLGCTVSRRRLMIVYLVGRFRRTL